MVGTIPFAVSESRISSCEWMESRRRSGISKARRCRLTSSCCWMSAVAWSHTSGAWLLLRIRPCARSGTRTGSPRWYSIASRACACRFSSNRLDAEQGTRKRARSRNFRRRHRYHAGAVGHRLLRRAERATRCTPGNCHRYRRSDRAQPKRSRGLACADTRRLRSERSDRTGCPAYGNRVPANHRHSMTTGRETFSVT